MKRTYVDANVLIAAFQGKEQISQRAMRVLEDPDRILVVSDYLRLEVLPKPTFQKREEEIQFMNNVFENAENCETSAKLTAYALTLASKYNMAPMDALHVGASVVAGVDELVTLEKPTKPMCKVKEVNVVSIYYESETAR